MPSCMQNRRLQIVHVNRILHGAPCRVRRTCERDATAGCRRRPTTSCRRRCGGPGRPNRAVLRPWVSVRTRRPRPRACRRAIPRCFRSCINAAIGRSTARHRTGKCRIDVLVASVMVPIRVVKLHEADSSLQPGAGPAGSSANDVFARHRLRTSPASMRSPFRCDPSVPARWFACEMPFRTRRFACAISDRRTASQTQVVHVPHGGDEVGLRGRC